METDNHGDSPEATAKPRRLRRAPVLLGLVAIVAVAALLSPLLLRRMDFFRVRRVEIVGARYIAPAVILDRLALDSTKTIWERLGPYEERVRHDPQISAVRITRRIPGTLVIHVVENLPVALLTTTGALQPVDRDGHALPIDPSRTAVDLPIVAKKDTLVLRMLDGVRIAEPRLFARISEVRWDERGGVRVILTDFTVRALHDCTAERFAEILPVEQDLVRRGQRAAELDLRYRDQIVARIE